MCLSLRGLHNQMPLGMEAVILRNGLGGTMKKLASSHAVQVTIVLQPSVIFASIFSFPLLRFAHSSASKT